jgi:DNA-binding LytR/AlgR family response regulator
MTNTVEVPLRALVVEDEWPARNYLVELLQGSGMAEVVGAVATAEQAREAISAQVSEVGIDCVFVDVRLIGPGAGETGLDLVRSFASHERAPMFVLATAFEQHALEAFELGVIDYLLKPFTEDRVAQTLRRLHSRRPSWTLPPGDPADLSGQRIVARRKRSLVFLELHEIWAFETQDRLTSVHTAHGTFDIDLSLTAIETSFGRTFLRVHRQWLVNASHIKELDRDGDETRLFVGAAIGDAANGVRVPVARERSAAVRSALLSNATGLRR